VRPATRLLPGSTTLLVRAARFETARRRATHPHLRGDLDDIALALNDVPIDVLAERMETTRGALYKTPHDARRALRRYLSERGQLPDTVTKETT
jgi:RNA polymerase sigma-70 factor (ECF subfamily)